MKKDLAIVLGATGNMTFALANVIIALSKNKPQIPFDIKVFSMEIPEKEKNILNSILPITFIDYEYPGKTEDSISTKKRFTKMAFSRYECFRMLNDYKNVLWLDIDLLIKGDIAELITTCDKPIGLWQSKQSLKINFTEEIDNYDTDKFFYNTGVFLIKDTLEYPKKYADWCYKKTNELSQYLYCADQGIINLMLQEFSLEVCNLDEKFNCIPRKKLAKDAVILHPYCAEKFWDFYNDKEWNENNKQWLKMGGAPYNGSRTGLLERIIKTKFPELPNLFKYPKGFIKYFKTQKYKDFDF